MRARSYGAPNSYGEVLGFESHHDLDFSIAPHKLERKFKLKEMPLFRPKKITSLFLIALVYFYSFCISIITYKVGLSKVSRICFICRMKFDFLFCGNLSANAKSFTNQVFGYLCSSIFHNLSVQRKGLATLLESKTPHSKAGNGIWCRAMHAQDLLDLRSICAVGYLVLLLHRAFFSNSLSLLFACARIVNTLKLRAEYFDTTKYVEILEIREKLIIRKIRNN